MNIKKIAACYLPHLAAASNDTMMLYTYLDCVHTCVNISTNNFVHCSHLKPNERRLCEQEALFTGEIRVRDQPKVVS